MGNVLPLPLVGRAGTHRRGQGFPGEREGTGYPGPLPALRLGEGAQPNPTRTPVASRPGSALPPGDRASPRWHAAQPPPRTEPFPCHYPGEAQKDSWDAEAVRSHPPPVTGLSPRAPRNPCSPRLVWGLADLLGRWGVRDTCWAGAHLQGHPTRGPLQGCAPQGQRSRGPGRGISATPGASPSRPWEAAGPASPSEARQGQSLPSELPRAKQSQPGRKHGRTPTSSGRGEPSSSARHAAAGPGLCLPTGLRSQARDVWGSHSQQPQWGGGHCSTHRQPPAHTARLRRRLAPGPRDGEALGRDPSPGPSGSLGCSR